MTKEQRGILITAITLFKPIYNLVYLESLTDQELTKLYDDSFRV